MILSMPIPPVASIICQMWEGCKGNRKKVTAFEELTFVLRPMVGGGDIRLHMISGLGPEFLDHPSDDKSCSRTRQRSTPED